MRRAVARAARLLLVSSFAVLSGTPHPVAVIAAEPPAATAALRRPLPAIERLVYSIEYGIIKAGTATLEIRPSGPSAALSALACETIELSSRARSRSFFDRFYPVDDEVRSLVDATTLLPLRFEKRLSEGSYRARESIVFDRAANQARYANGDTISIPPDARDVLSAFYEVRRMRVVPGDTLHFVNHAGRKTMQIEVRVLKREMVETRVGRFRCLKTQPVIVSGGLFKNQGQLWVWFTDDARMIPARMESKLTFGSIVAELERVDRPDLTLEAKKGGARPR